MQIFKLSSNGWKICKELRLEALREDLEAYGTLYEEAIRYSEEDWKDFLNNPNNIVLVGQKGEDTVGIVAANQMQGKKVGHVANLWGIYVRKAFRRRGFGKQLMEAVLNQLTANESIEKIRLNINSSKTAALRLYSGLGFQIVGTLHREMKLSDGYHDEYLMEKFL